MPPSRPLPGPAGRVGVPPGPLRRAVLVLLQTLGPYIAERMAAPQDEGFAAWQAARWGQQGAPPPSSPSGASGGALQAARNLGETERKGREV